MGLPYAPNAVPLGMNPGGRRLTTRIHYYKSFIGPIMAVPHNPNRVMAVVYADYQNTNFPEISIDPDDESSWCTPYSIQATPVYIYGSMAIYLRFEVSEPSTPCAAIVYEYVYE